MANFANPTVGSNYTDFPTEIRASVDAALQMLSVGSHTNIPTGAIKWDAGLKRFLKYNGSSFDNLTDEYRLDANVNLNRADFGDNDQARFGNSHDLLIYHNSSDSYVQDNGTGKLVLSTNGTAIDLFDSANSNALAKFITGGSCELYENGTKRLETNGNGIQVTNRVGIGGLANNSLDVFGNIVQFGASNTTDQQFRLGRSGSGNRNAYIDFIGDNTYSTFGLRIVRNGTQGSNATSEITHRGTGAFRLMTQDSAEIQFHIGSSQRAVITSAGNFGLSTSSPVVLLDAGGASSGGVAGLNNAVLYAGLTNNTNFGGVVLGAGLNGNTPFIAASKKSDGTALSLDLTTSATSRMRITNTGRLAVGLTSAGTQLHVAHASAEISSLNTTNCLDLGLRLQATGVSNTTGNIYSGITLGEGRAGLYAYDDGGGAAHGLGFWTGSNSGVSEKVRIQSDGKVGISTNSPQARLDVSRLGNAWTGPSPIAGTTILAHSGTTATTSPSYLNLAAGTAAISGIHFGDTDDIDVGIFQYSHTDNAFQWRTNGGGTDMVLDSVGRIGLGLTNPDTDLVIQKTSPSLKLTSTSTVGNTNLYFGDTDANTQGQIQFHNNGDFFRVYIGGNEHVRIDSSGRVGIGTASPSQKLEVSGNLKVTSGLALLDNDQRVQWGSSNVAFIEGNDNEKLVFGVGAERMRINSSGNVGISTNSPQVQLDVGGVTTTGLGGLSNSVFYAGFTNNTNFGGVVLGSGVNGNTPFIASSKKSNGTGLPLAFFAFGAEVFRISQNALRIGQTSTDTAGQDNTTVGVSIGKSGRISGSTSGTETGLNLNTNTTSNSKHYISFRRSGTQIGSVTQNGASNVAFNTSSDRRLKENITDLKDALTNLLKLKPRRFNFIADETKQTVDGLIAQEVEETGVCTNAVWKDKDNKEMMQIDYSKFMTLAIASIQELAAKVSDLETKLG